MTVDKLVKDMAVKAKDAARQLRGLGQEKKDAALELMAVRLIERQTEIVQENAKDLSAAKEKGLTSAMIDRLTLDPMTIQSMAEGLREVAALPDPIGEVTGLWKRPNGLDVGRIRIPLGVIGFIY